MPTTLITTMLTGLPTVSTTALLCAGFAGLAVLLALRSPAGQLRRITPRKSRLAVAVMPMVRLLWGRADAPPLAQRVLLSLACILALGVAGARIDGWLGSVVWFAVPVVAATGVLALGWVEPQSTRRRRRAVDHGGSADVGADGCLSRRWIARPYGVRGGRADLRRPCR